MKEQEIAQLKRRLPQIKSLSMLKMEKNFIALEKGYPRQPYNAPNQPTSFLISRIEDELTELKQAFKKLDIAIMKEECADISNIVDYLFEMLLQFEMKKKEAQP
jgi:chromosomal replication initiation ATPase DnaA